MLYFNFNGKILEEHSPVTGPDNRGLRYGDGLFETIRYRNGRLILAGEHFARLWKGMQLLKFQIHGLFTPELLEDKIMQLVNKNKLTDARVRLAVTRKDGGLYDTRDHSPDYIIQAWSLADTSAGLNENGLQLCIYRDAKKVIDRFSNLKHNNFLPYFMAALEAKEQQCNDAIVLNIHGRICDSSIANIFLISNERIITPSLDEGCIAGIMRSHIIRQLKAAGYEVKETAITEEMLFQAEELFLTNSIINIRWIAGIAGATYSNHTIKKITQLLCQTNAEVFC